MTSHFVRKQDTEKGGLISRRVECFLRNEGDGAGKNKWLLNHDRQWLVFNDRYHFWPTARIEVILDPCYDSAAVLGDWIAL